MPRLSAIGQSKMAAQVIRHDIYSLTRRAGARTAAYQYNIAAISREAENKLVTMYHSNCFDQSSILEIVMTYNKCGAYLSPIAV